jgi:hypothetical protein
MKAWNLQLLHHQRSKLLHQVYPLHHLVLFLLLFPLHRPQSTLVTPLETLVQAVQPISSLSHLNSYFSYLFWPSCESQKPYVFLGLTILCSFSNKLRLMCKTIFIGLRVVILSPLFLLHKVFWICQSAWSNHQLHKVYKLRDNLTDLL